MTVTTATTTTLTDLFNTGVGLDILAIAIIAVALVASYINGIVQARRFANLAAEEAIECVGLESLSAEEYLDMEDAIDMEVHTTPIMQVYDNVVYLAVLPKASAQDTTVMESDITLKQNVEMAFWATKRAVKAAAVAVVNFGAKVVLTTVALSVGAVAYGIARVEKAVVAIADTVEAAVMVVVEVVNFVKTLAGAPARIVELEAKIAAMQAESFDFNFYDDADNVDIANVG